VLVNPTVRRTHQRGESAHRRRHIVRIGSAYRGYHQAVNTSDDDDRRGGTLEPLPDDEAGDFAAEHDETTLSGQVEGGPEHTSEPESPAGDAGMDD
jgi:hypothetical protein